MTQMTPIKDILVTLSRKHKESIFNVYALVEQISNVIVVPDKVINCIFEVSCNEYNENKDYLHNNLFINSQSVNKNNKKITFVVNGDKDLTPIFLLQMKEAPNKDIELAGTLTLNCDKSNYEYKLVITLSNSISTASPIYSRKSNVINTASNSFMLARTNPKLSGNIKLVVDSNYKLYLDTFKVTKTLEDNKYRHQEISAEGNYPHDVYRVFGKMPKGELWKTSEDLLNPHKIYHNYDYQYETCYEYGAETNSDGLYSENMKILAPLWLNSDVPDFFCIFRVPGSFNEESYKNGFDDTAKLKEFLRDAEIIKYYDLRKHTSIGLYLNNYVEQIKSIAGLCHLQFNHFDQANGSTNTIDSGRNVWKGIAVNKGIIADKTETTYFFDKVIDDTQDQAKLNMFIVNGFERNNLIVPNIINLEFMFDDKESENMSMHRYFGLYLKENDIINYDYIVKNVNKNKIEINAYIDNEISDNTQLKHIFTYLDKEQLLFAVTPETANRIKSTEEFEKYSQTNISNIPYENIISVEAEKIDETNIDEYSFLSMKFTKPIKYGEHFRVVLTNTIDKDNFEKTNMICLGNKDTSKNIIFEVIASNDKRLLATPDKVFPYVQTNLSDFNILTEKKPYMRSSVNFDYTQQVLPDTSIYHHTDIELDKRGEISNYPVKSLVEFGTEELMMGRFKKSQFVTQIGYDIIRNDITAADSDPKNSKSLDKEIHDAQLASGLEDPSTYRNSEETSLYELIMKSANCGPYEINPEKKSDYDYTGEQPISKFDTLLVENGGYVYTADFDSNGKQISQAYPVIESNTQSPLISKAKTLFRYFGNQNIAVIDTAEDGSPYPQNSEFLQKNKKYEFETENRFMSIVVEADIFTKYPEIYRISFYTQDEDIDEVAAPLNEQLERLAAAFSKFKNNKLFVSCVGTNQLSLMTNYKNAYFQHIDSAILDFDPVWLNESLRTIDYTKTYKESSIKYFSEKCKSILRPLNFNTCTYTSETGPFAPFNFEILGWRYTDIVKFIKLANYTYDLYADIISDARTTDCMIAKTSFGYMPIKEFEISQNYPCVNDAALLDEFYNHIEEIEDSTNMVMSPFKPGHTLISSQYTIELINNHIGLYKPMPCNISLMGIYNLKDLDCTYDLQCYIDVDNRNLLEFTDGTIIKTDGSISNLEENTIYVLLKGSFSGMSIQPGQKFLIKDKMLYYSHKLERFVINKDGLTSASAKKAIKRRNILNAISYELISGNSLTAVGDVLVKRDGQENNSNKYLLPYSQMLSKSMYDDQEDNTKLKYSLVVNTNCYWESNGLYSDFNNILDTQNIIKDAESALTKFYEYKSNDVTRSILESFNVDSSVETIENIIDGNSEIELSNSIMQYLTSNKQLIPAIGYYNKYVDSLDFIYYGLKFSLKLNNENFNTDIKLLDYNKYKVYIINEYMPNKHNKLIFSSEENIVLIINHCFDYKKIKSSKPYENDAIVLSDTLSKTTYGWEYYNKRFELNKLHTNFTYFYLPTKNISDNNQQILELNDSNSVYLQSDISKLDGYHSYNKYAQFDWNKVKTFDWKRNYATLEYDEELSDSKIFPRSYASYEGDDLIGTSDYYNITNDSILLESTSYQVLNQTQLKNTECDVMQRFIDSMSNNYDVYVVGNQQNNLQLSINRDYYPLEIKISKPNRIKYNYGYFNPRFIDLLEFNARESDELSKISNCNFLLSNTSISNVCKLKQYFYNRVFNNSYDSVCDKNFSLQSEKSLLSSCWDSKYYELSFDQTTSSKIDGYTTGIEDKSFIGSKCLVINSDKIILNDWRSHDGKNIITYNIISSSHNEKSKASQILEIRLNVTNALYNLLNTSENYKVFTSNWSGFTKHTKTHINNYVKQTVTKYFKINEKAKVNVYSKLNDLKERYSVLSAIDDSASYTKLTNFKTRFENVNDDIIIVIEIQDYKNRSFYPIVTITR